MRFDVDALSAEFGVLTVKFRGGEYALGTSVQQVLDAVGVASSVPDGAKLEQQLTLLVPMLKALSPELAASLDGAAPLSMGEELILHRVVQEAMGRIGKVPFREVEQS